MNISSFLPIGLHNPQCWWVLPGRHDRQFLSTDEAEGIISDLEGEGRIDMSGSRLNIKNPADPDASLLAGQCRGGPRRQHR